ncbi:MAG TPA: DUF4395 family protein [Holophagaceae bacterium]
MDEAAGRLGALLSMGLILLAAWKGWGALALALAADFALRAAGWPDLSPVARAAVLARRLSGLAPRPVNAGPKRFAASVGCLFSMGTALALLAGARALGLGLAAVLTACAGLEAAFGFCLACRLHPWLVRAYPGRRHLGIP